jgi:hypothetical protein
MRPFPLLACSAVLAVSLTGCADATSIAHWPQPGRSVQVNILDRSSGERLPLYRHRGRLYVAGHPGHQYSIELTNRSGGRTLSVVSVDGVNVLNGETANPAQTGYVLWAGQQFGINGWRKNLSEVSTFYFTALPNSYAARTGRAGDVGVIGVAVFHERPPVPEVGVAAAEPMRESRAPRADAAAQDTEALASGASSIPVPAPATAPLAAQRGRSESVARKAAEKLGTGHGQREASQVSMTDFERATTRPAEIVTIYYDSRENLIAQGVIPAAPPMARPRPFPGADLSFVPDPPHR